MSSYLIIRVFKNDKKNAKKIITIILDISRKTELK